MFEMIEMGVHGGFIFFDDSGSSKIEYLNILWFENFLSHKVASLDHFRVSAIVGHASTTLLVIPPFIVLVLMVNIPHPDGQIIISHFVGSYPHLLSLEFWRTFRTFP